MRILVLTLVVWITVGCENFAKVVGPDDAVAISGVLPITNAAERTDVAGGYIEILLSGTVLVRELHFGQTATIDLTNVLPQSKTITFSAKGWSRSDGNLQYLGCEAYSLNLRSIHTSGIDPWSVTRLSLTRRDC